MNILIVEDNPTDMKLFSAVLDAGGHRVLGKISAEEALLEIQARRPEMILLDLRLPGMDGLALARLLKQNPSTRQIPIVALTAAREEFTRAAALEAGCDAFILKPVDTRRLTEEVVNIASKAG